MEMRIALAALAACLLASGTAQAQIISRAASSPANPIAPEIA